MKRINISLLGVLLFFASCNSQQEKKVNAELLASMSGLSFTDSVSLDIADGISSMYFENGKLVLERESSNPVFVTVSSQGGIDEQFVTKGHGHGEYMSPQLVGTHNGLFYIYDSPAKTWNSLHDGKLQHSRKLAIGHPSNQMRLIMWPLVGYSYIDGNKDIWEVRNIESDKAVAQLTFEDELEQEEGYLQSFSWDNYGKYVVFAQKYYNQIRLCSISKDGSILSQSCFVFGTSRPDASKCFFSNVACGREFFFVLSQHQLEFASNTLTGDSELLVFNYSGEIIERFVLDGQYLKMTMDKEHDMLYLLNINEDCIKTFSLNQRDRN